jgi:uncharacterized protein YecE (DUF72 family)
MVRIGTAGWVIPKQYATAAGGAGSHLERYGRELGCVEVNSSFYRSHRRSTWERWAGAVPEGFRFAVKFPKAVTHGARLVVEAGSLDGFFEEVSGLGEKLGVVLVQLPPSLAFEDCPAAEFFEAVRERFGGTVVVEPRHKSWFGRDAEELLVRHKVGRGAADPARDGGGWPPAPGGWDGVAYFRLHGRPRMYYSEYGEGDLRELAGVVKGLGDREVWVVFDNTALGFAFGDALKLGEIVG